MLQAEPVEAIEAPGLLTLHPDDDVAVALRPLAAGERLEVEIAAAIPRGHKVALRTLPAGAEVRKYGWPIGWLTAPVAPGEHVHSHNLVTLLTGVEGYDCAPAPAIARDSGSDVALMDGLIALRQIFPASLAGDAPFRDAARAALATLKEPAHA